MWDSLPNDLKELKPGNAFKKALHLYVNNQVRLHLDQFIWKVKLIMLPFINYVKYRIHHFHIMHRVNPSQNFV